MTREVRVSGRKIRSISIPMWVHDEAVEGVYPTRVLDFKNDRYFDADDIAEKTFSDLNVFTRSGVAWDWQMIGGNLELVEIADGVRSQAVDPVTGLNIGDTVMPAVTRLSPYYQAEISHFYGGAGFLSMTDKTLNVLGQFNCLEVESDASTTYLHGKEPQRVSLTLSTPLCVSWIVQNIDASEIVVGMRDYSASNEISNLVYDTTTNVLTPGDVSSGNFANYVANQLDDGSIYITTIFTPNFTSDYSCTFGDSINNTSGQKFYIVANFLYDCDAGTPLPILGTEGATFTTNGGSITGSKSVTGVRSVVQYHRRLLHGGDFNNSFGWGESGGAFMEFDTHTDQKQRALVNNGVDATQHWRQYVANYGERKAMGLAINTNDIRRSEYDNSDGLHEATSIITHGLYLFDDYGVGVDHQGNNPIGSVTEKITFWNVRLSDGQMTDLIQRGF